MSVRKLIAVAGVVWAGSLGLVWPTLKESLSPVLYADADDRGHANDRDRGYADDRDRHESALDRQLARVLREQTFTGTIESQLERRLGRPINHELANLGRLLWFDKVHSLHQDNTCAGCHSPTNGFGDTQSIAIGVDNNNLVGPNRTGPRNQRRSPFVINTAFLPKLMWNGRFSANAASGGELGDPFSNRFGFHFPLPEGDAMCPPGDDDFEHLLVAQAHIPPTELVEVGGFTGTTGTFGDLSHFFEPFDNGKGLPVPDPDHTGFRNDAIRAEGIGQLNAVPRYRSLFGRIFRTVREGAPIDFVMFAKAIAEFEFTLTFANAPIDRFARGHRGAMTDAEKRGALVFFGEGNCVTCHAVKGKSNEMFSDFENRVIGVPQIAPAFGVGRGNMLFDGPAGIAMNPAGNEDFGLEQITFDPNDRYKFRTAPLRNLAVSPAFFHNGSFARLDDAIRYHLNPLELGPRYRARNAGIDKDLTRRLGPIAPVLARLDPELRRGIHLTELETNDLIQFVWTGLLDKRASKENLCKLVPRSVPSGLPVLEFEGCNR